MRKKYCNKSFIFGHMYLYCSSLQMEKIGFIYLFDERIYFNKLNGTQNH